jgi:glucose/arabinose dehydrogenase
MKHINVPTFAVLGAVIGLCAAAAMSCASHEAAGGNLDGGIPGNDASVDGAPALDALPWETSMPAAGTFCSLPGSVAWTAGGPIVVPGGPATGSDLTWLKLPPGFCAHHFATVPDVRQLRFAPGGDLFAASPTTETTGGNPSGAMAGIAVLPDDNHDGFADSNITFLSNLPSIQGLLFTKGSFYYQDDATIRGIPYQANDRKPSGAQTPMTTITAPQDSLHWPKVMDIAADGTIFVTNGGSQNDQCLSTNPTRGAIFAVQPDGSTALVAKGFRNPIALRCEANHNVCLVAELALDYSANQGGREKLVAVRPGDDWGFPCCATKNLPYSTATYMDTGAIPDCSGVTAETDSFVIGHTPFGLDFESGKWPAPWSGRVFVTLHGEAGSWSGARVVAIALDPNTGLPVLATELGDGGPSPDAMLQFATGWDDGMQDHGRPAPIAFAPDGRMFLGNDYDGIVVWIAPVDLKSQ